MTLLIDDSAADAGSVVNSDQEGCRGELGKYNEPRCTQPVSSITPQREIL
ncbi:hypothetical protein [Candidatus Vallotia tarda]|uniref:Uncharacterized protein n=1 Tax=Candidatus Vallotiella hemipterorum TaxID=1177213 RepID=A0A916JVA7_9BURK|nr:hypothetical protein [Candidatus Vallotia tarda]CAG7603437.1 hypothetical protein MYVALT_E_00330 [Candidatus Vallotia tarda]